MESLGKEHVLEGRVVHQGLAVYGNKGSTDQHAYVQQLRDGLPNFFVTFVRILRDREGVSRTVAPGVTSGDFLDGFLLGTRQALFESGRPSITLTLPDVSARSIGLLVALYERAVGFYASLVNVNAYDQPGVEAGKQAAAAILELQQRSLAVLRDAGGRELTAFAVARAAGAPDEAETVLHVLERLAANPDRGVRRMAGPSILDATFRWTEPVP
jgi:glucose-6-phosphate isomerase